MRRHQSSGSSDLYSTAILTTNGLLQVRCRLDARGETSGPPERSMYGLRGPQPGIIVASRAGDVRNLQVLLRQHAMRKYPWSPLRRTLSVLEVTDSCGRTPLMWASLRGNVDVIELLLEAGAAPNAADQKGRTALFLACLNGEAEAAKMLLEAGAKCKATRAGSTPLIAAACHGHVAVVDVLLKLAPQGAARVGIDAQDRRGLTALAIATSRGHVDILLRLLEAGADWSLSDEQGWTPAELAHIYGHPECFRLLQELERRQLIYTVRDWVLSLPAGSDSGDSGVTSPTLSRVSSDDSSLTSTTNSTNSGAISRCCSMSRDILALALRELDADAFGDLVASLCSEETGKCVTSVSVDPG